VRGLRFSIVSSMLCVARECRLSVGLLKAWRTGTTRSSEPGVKPLANWAEKNVRSRHLGLLTWANFNSGNKRGENVAMAGRT
jgi:hypothetical protein